MGAVVILQERREDLWGQIEQYIFEEVVFRGHTVLFDSGVTH